MEDEEVLVPADKHKKYLQDDTIILGLCNQTLQSTQNN